MNSRRIMAIIIAIIALALILMAVRSFLSDDRDATPSGPSDEKTHEDSSGPQRRTDYIEDAIARRLSEVSGAETRVSCPETVPTEIDTAFECEARYAGDKTVVSTVKVTIDGPDGHYNWDAAPTDDAEPSTGG